MFSQKVACGPKLEHSKVYICWMRRNSESRAKNTEYCLIFLTGPLQNLDIRE